LGSNCFSDYSENFINGNVFLENQNTLKISPVTSSDKKLSWQREIKTKKKYCIEILSNPPSVKFPLNSLPLEKLYHFTRQRRSLPAAATATQKARTMAFILLTEFSNGSYSLYSQN